MNYSIFLTQASDEAKAELAKHFSMCECCKMSNTIWLDASNVTGKVIIHGAGHFDKDSMGLPVNEPTAEKVCRFYVADTLAHGNTVILTPDVNEFISLINKYYPK